MINSAPIIHPMCVIDEQAKSVRICDWFIPKMPPIMAFSAAHIARMCLFEDCGHAAQLSRAKGASFCQVVSNRAPDQDNDVITEGYQK